MCAHDSHTHTHTHSHAPTQCAHPSTYIHSKRALTHTSRTSGGQGQAEAKVWMLGPEAPTNRGAGIDNETKDPTSQPRRFDTPHDFANNKFKR